MLLSFISCFLLVGCDVTNFIDNTFIEPTIESAIDKEKYGNPVSFFEYVSYHDSFSYTLDEFEKDVCITGDDKKGLDFWLLDFARLHNYSEISPSKAKKIHNNEERFFSCSLPKEIFFSSYTCGLVQIHVFHGHMNSPFYYLFDETDAIQMYEFVKAFFITYLEAN